MTILRDLVARITFKTDTTGLERLNNKMDLVKRSIAGIATTALAGWALRTGGDLDFLQQQLNIGGDRLDSLKEKIKELSSVDAFGTSSIFSRKELTQAAINLDKAGISAQDLALRLEQSSTLLTRAGTTSIAEVSTRFAQALQRGGISDLFREFRLISVKTAEELRIIESQIATSSGVLQERETRKYRERIAEIIIANKEVLEGERAALVGSTTGLNMRVGAAMQNLWQEVARSITKFLQPALETVVGLVKSLEMGIKKVRTSMEGAGDEFKSVSDFVKGLFDTPVGATLTLGGVAMFMITRNPAWLAGGIGGASLLSMITEDWKGVEGFLKTPIAGKIVGGTVGALIMAILTKIPLWILGGAAAGAKVGGLAEEFLKDILKDLDPKTYKYIYGGEGVPSDLGSPATPGSGERDLGVEEIFERPGGVPSASEDLSPISSLSVGGQNVSVSVGNVNITIQGAGSSALEVARLVKKEFEEQVLRVAMEFGVLHEGVS